MISNPNIFTVGRVNTDEAEELVLDYKIEGVPTIILLKGDISVE